MVMGARLDPHKAQVVRNAPAKAFNALPYREREILRARYGLGDNPPMTLEAIALTLNMSTEMVRQEEAQAINALKMLEAMTEEPCATNPTP